MNFHKLTRRATALLLAACLCTPLLRATERDTTLFRRLIPVVGADFRPAYTFPTDGFFKGNNQAGEPIRANLSGHLKLGFQFAPGTRFGDLYPHTVQGIGVAYNTFFNRRELGNPVAVYVFQTSRIASLTRRLSLDYEWNFGASFGWKKYDPEDNYMNQVVGSKINAYINLGFFLNWQLDAQTDVKAGVSLTHFSNGNTNYPNAGVNTIGGNIGITRYFGRPDRDKTSPAPARLAFKPYVSYDVVLYGATRKKGVFPANSDPILVPGSFAIVGLNFNPMYNFSRYFRAGLSLDAQYDESANIGQHIANEGYTPSADNIRFHRPPFIEQFAVGLSVRAEVVMPIFSINLGIGRNIICKGPDTNAFYQILALKTHLTDRLFLHVGYQLSRFKDPNNLMLGLGYRFGKSSPSGH